MIATLKRLFVPNPTQEQIHRVYVALVEQSRKPYFYTQCQVEDTVDGRFDMIVLHLSLLLDRIEQEKPNGAEAFTQELMEVFFADMDRSLREMGASDTGIGKRIQKMAQAFFGRLKAYQDAGNEEALVEAIGRNVYREKPGNETPARLLAAYMMRNREHLHSAGDLMQGSISFLD